MARKCVRVIFFDDERELEIASSIQIVLPNDMAIVDAQEYLAYRISKEVNNYAADECARHFFK